MNPPTRVYFYNCFIRYGELTDSRGLSYVQLPCARLILCQTRQMVNVKGNPMKTQTLNFALNKTSPAPTISSQSQPKWNMIVANKV